MNLFKNAKETLTNYSLARKGNQKAKDDIETLAIRKNLKKFGVSPSQVRSEMTGGFPSQNVRNYLKARDASIKEGRARLGF